MEKFRHARQSVLSPQFNQHVQSYVCSWDKDALQAIYLFVNVLLLRHNSQFRREPAPRRSVPWRGLGPCRAHVDSPDRNRPTASSWGGTGPCWWSTWAYSGSWSENQTLSSVACNWQADKRSILPRKTWLWRRSILHRNFTYYCLGVAWHCVLVLSQTEKPVSLVLEFLVGEIGGRVSVFAHACPTVCKKSKKENKTKKE